MKFDIDAAAVQQGEPGVAEWRVFGGDEVVAEFDAGAATGDQRAQRP